MAPAQDLYDIDGPAEQPPAGFSGAQFVDSEGCIFVRAGFGGNTVWVPRVTRDRQQLCGFAPTFAAAQPALAPAPRVVAAPAPIAPAAPVIAAPTIAAPAHAARITAAVPAPAQPSAAAAASAPAPRVITIPRGYRLAWTDGRLNAQRGPRDAAGTAAMQTIWTDSVPQRLRKDAAPGLLAAAEPAPAKAAPASGMAVTPSVSRAAPAAAPLVVAPAAPAATGRYVQVGTFGVAANARAALARLGAAGMPAATQDLTRAGRTLQVVLAGPFADAASLASALARLRAQGFADAFVR